MTVHDFYEFTVRTIPAAVGTALYAFTQLGIVAWLTSIWMLVQMVQFCTDWYRIERDRARKAARLRAAEDKAEEGYP